MPLKKHFAFVFLLALLAMGCSPASHAEESIWSAVVLATNEELPKDPAPEIKNYYAKLKDVFGYNQFELIGHHQEFLNSPEERWLVPGKDFSLQVNSKQSSKEGFYRMKLELFQDKKLLAEMDARFSGQNVLFIRGPLYGMGQFIIILVLK